MLEPPSSIPWWVASLGSPPPSLPVTGLYRTAGFPSSTTRHQCFPLKDAQHAHTRGDPERSQRPTGLSASLALLPHMRPTPSHGGGRKERLRPQYPSPHQRTQPEVTPSQRRPSRRRDVAGPRETGKCQGSPKPKCKNSV